MEKELEKSILKKIILGTKISNFDFLLNLPTRENNDLFTAFPSVYYTHLSLVPFL